jgi:hypothetical protein
VVLTSPRRRAKLLQLLVVRKFGKLWSKVHAGVKLQKAALMPTFHHQRSMLSMDQHLPRATKPENALEKECRAESAIEEPVAGMRADGGDVRKGAWNGDAIVPHPMDSNGTTGRAGDLPAAGEARHAAGGELKDLRRHCLTWCVKV